MLPEDVSTGLVPRRGGEGRLGAEVIGVVAGRDEQGGGAVRADAVCVEQAGEVCFDVCGYLLVEVVGFPGQVVDAGGEELQHVLDGVRRTALL
ncbi:MULTISPECIES: hypothetical protein [unclassified Streptomyces]|uniref:hypothetical protein n=1 Tax=unclassified Streptomyces TaxID=2593676 RepID=UPI0022558AFC|nr:MULTISPECIES: hypothetical protein [unclassified Streptomyces]MCX4409374.1 hypothetical protein [Streptomyces sp. NBC_01764]MCX5191138.1 hypothetical protein [Streptomyces sp. NBC_00268]